MPSWPSSSSHRATDSPSVDASIRIFAGRGPRTPSPAHRASSPRAAPAALPRSSGCRPDLSSCEHRCQCVPRLASTLRLLTAFTVVGLRLPRQWRPAAYIPIIHALRIRPAAFSFVTDRWKSARRRSHLRREHRHRLAGCATTASWKHSPSAAISSGVRRLPPFAGPGRRRVRRGGALDLANARCTAASAARRLIAMCSCTTFSILLPSSSCVVVMRDESHAKAARSTGGLNGYLQAARLSRL